jgi:hypothetical protein
MAFCGVRFKIVNDVTVPPWGLLKLLALIGAVLSKGFELSSGRAVIGRDGVCILLVVLVRLNASTAQQLRCAETLEGHRSRQPRTLLPAGLPQGPVGSKLS